MYAILNQNELWFFNQNFEEAPESFLINGTTVATSNEVILEIKNSDKQSCVISFESAEILTEWKQLIEARSSYTELLLQNTPLNDDSESDVDVNKTLTCVNFEVPRICFIFEADQQNLRPDLGIDDPYDCGIFSFEDS